MIYWYTNPNARSWLMRIVLEHATNYIYLFKLGLSRMCEYHRGPRSGWDFEFFDRRNFLEKHIWSLVRRVTDVLSYINIYIYICISIIDHACAAPNLFEWIRMNTLNYYVYCVPQVLQSILNACSQPDARTSSSQTSKPAIF